MNFNPHSLLPQAPKRHLLEPQCTSQITPVLFLILLINTLSYTLPTVLHRLISLKQNKYILSLSFFTYALAHSFGTILFLTHTCNNLTTHSSHQQLLYHFSTAHPHTYRYLQVSLLASVLQPDAFSPLRSLKHSSPLAHNCIVILNYIQQSFKMFFLFLPYSILLI